MCVLAFLLVFCHALVLTEYCAADLVNERVSRKIDISGAVAKHVVDVALRNDGESSVSSFCFTLSELESEKLGDLCVKHKNEKLFFTRLSRKSSPLTQGSGVAYEVLLGNPVPPGGRHEVTILYDLVRSIIPVPNEMEEAGQQYLRFAGNQYYYSPYKSVKTTTELSLEARAKEISLVPPGSQSRIRGSKIVLGPYENVGELSFEYYFVRFQSNRGLLVAASVLKEFFVSHWGNIRVKEEYNLENHGAKHMGRWSRIDYTRDPKHSLTSLADVWATLPKDATNVAYRDLIGNITTSRLRQPTKKGRPVRLVFRYPLLGGWKNYFWLTYDVMLKNFVNSKGSSHVMKVPFTPSFDTDILCEKLKVMILLPEGVRNVQTIVPENIGFVTGKGNLRTTLNYFGRKVLTFERTNLRSKSPHGSVLYISYEYVAWQMLQAPLIVISTLLALFVGIILYSRLDFALVKDGTYEQQKARKRKLVIKLDGYNEEVHFLNGRIRQLIKASTRSGNFANSEADRKSLETSIQKAEENIETVLLELSNEGLVSSKQRDGVLQRYALQRNATGQLVKRGKLLVEGKIRAQDFDEEVRDKILPLARAAADDLDDFVMSLTESL